MSSKARSSEDENHCAPDTFGRTDAAGRVVDAHYLEQRHGGSSEAVMLTDELDTVLWVNSAFKHLSSERMISRMQVHISSHNLQVHFCEDFSSDVCNVFVAAGNWAAY
jgi:hypothetical protein